MTTHGDGVVHLVTGPGADDANRTRWEASVGSLVQRMETHVGWASFERALEAGRVGPVLVALEGMGHPDIDVARLAAEDAGVALWVFGQSGSGVAEALPLSLLESPAALRHLLAQSSGARGAVTGDPWPGQGAHVRRFVRDTLSEFCTPLTTIREFSSLLVDGLAGEIGDRQREYLEYVLTATRDLLTAFGDFRSSIEFQFGQVPVAERSCCLTPVFQELRRGFSGSRTPLELSDVERLPEVRGDAELLTTTLTRLLRFAVKVTPHPGSVRLEAALEGEAVEFRVHCGGPRPSDADVALLRGGPPGHDHANKSVTQVFGVGLELAQQLIFHLGGRLVLEASEEGGGQLRFRLPTARRASSAA